MARRISYEFRLGVVDSEAVFSSKRVNKGMHVLSF